MAVSQDKLSWTTLIAPSAAQPVDPAQFLGSRRVPLRTLVNPLQFNAPTLHFGPVPAPLVWACPALDFAPRRTPTEGRQALIRCLNRLSGVVVSEPIWDDRRGPKTHSRRTDRKLGQLRLARQGLVRVPESNTKYGGQRGITGGNAAPVMGASISESSQTPNAKICLAGSKFRLLPLFTGQLFIRRKGLPWRDSRRPTDGSHLTCAAANSRGPK